MVYIRTLLGIVERVSKKKYAIRIVYLIVRKKKKKDMLKSMSLNVFLGKDDMNKLSNICSLVPYGKEIQTLEDFLNYQNLVREFAVKLAAESTSTNKLIATSMALESYGQVCVIVHKSVNEYKVELERLKKNVLETIGNIPDVI